MALASPAPTSNRVQRIFLRMCVLLGKSVRSPTFRPQAFGITEWICIPGLRPKGGTTSYEGSCGKRRQMRPPVSVLLVDHEEKAGKTICRIVERLRGVYAICHISYEIWHMAYGIWS